MPKLFALVLTNELPWDRDNSTALCWCMGWREVRSMLRYYRAEKGAITVIRVRGHRPFSFRHSFRKLPPGEFKRYWHLFYDHETQPAIPTEGIL